MNELNRVPVGCPSEFSLERLRLAELEPAEAMVLMNHVEGCAACGRRIEELASSPPPFDLDAVWNAARAAGPEPRSRARWLRAVGQRWRLAVTATVAVTAAASVALTWRPAPQPTDVVKGKGSPWTFAVLVKRHGQERVIRPLSGVHLSSGDRLRFEVATKSVYGYAAVIGADSRGMVAPLAPPVGDAVLIAAGPSVLLEGAVELDDAPGAERIDLFGCPRPVAVAELSRAVREAVTEARGDLAGVRNVAPGCYRETFWIEKVKP